MQGRYGAGRTVQRANNPQAPVEILHLRKRLDQNVITLARHDGANGDDVDGF